MRIRRPVRRSPLRGPLLPVLLIGSAVIILTAWYYVNRAVSGSAPDLTGFQSVIHQEDVNADGRNERLLILPRPDAPIARDLRADGYTLRFDELVVLQGDAVLLRVTRDAMTDADGTVLLGQERAAHGYAFRRELWEEPAVYAGPVVLLHVVMTDSAGEAVSDEITLYWKPSTGRYAATNTFGAEGTF